jgi:hypothetical protein
VNAALTGGMVTCRGCAGQFDDDECRHPNIDKRSCWHASKHPANAGIEFPERSGGKLQ